jgi:hypothetical protein
MPKRNDPLAAMRARRQISVAQYRAGRAWQKLHKQGATAALARCSRRVGEPIESPLVRFQARACCRSLLKFRLGEAFDLFQVADQRFPNTLCHFSRRRFHRRFACAHPIAEAVALASAWRAGLRTIGASSPTSLGRATSWPTLEGGRQAAQDEARSPARGGEERQGMAVISD